MSKPAANHPLFRRHVLAGIACGAAGIALFQFFGNATRGYIETSSLFYWWGFQWMNPGSETEHGWLVLGLSAWLLWKNLSIADRGLRIADFRTSETTRDRRPESGNRKPPETGDRSPETGNWGSETGQREPETGEGEWKAGETTAEATPGPRSPSSTIPLFPVSGVRSPVSANPQSAIRNPQLRSRSAVAAMLVGLALHALGFAAQQTRVSILAFLIFTWGVLRLAGGRRWGNAAMFPLAFMVFALPISVLDEVGLPLRLWVTHAGEWIAQLAGIDVLRSGTQLVAPDGRFNYDVAAPCSGVRSLMALTALSVLIGYLNFRSWRRRALVLALCFPLVYLGNVARIVSIIFAAQAGGPEWGDRAHVVMGYGVFAIVLGGVLLTVAAIHRWWPERNAAAEVPANAERLALKQLNVRSCDPKPVEVNSLHHESESAREVEPGSTDSRTSPPRGGPARRLFLGVTIVLGVIGAEMLFLHRLAEMPPRGQVGVVLAEDGLNPVELPAFLGTEWIGQRAEVSAVEREILPPDTGFSRKNYAYVADRTRDVFLSIVLSGRDRTSIHRPELCLVGQGWTIEDAAQQTFQFPANGSHGGEAFQATVLRVRREVSTSRGRRVVPQLVAYWFVGGETLVPSHGERFMRDAWNRIAHARADRWAYVLMQTDARDGEAAAIARMQTVLDGTLPVFQKPLATEPEPRG